MAQRLASISACLGGGSSLHQPVTYTLQQLQLQGFCTFFWCGVYRADAFEQLADFWGLGRIGKSMILMPARQSGQAMFQGVDGQCGRIISQIACDRLAAGGQQAAPFDLKMANG